MTGQYLDRITCYGFDLSSLEEAVVMILPRSKSLAVCNNKGGVGEIALAFEIAWELASRGHKVALLEE